MDVGVHEDCAAHDPGPSHPDVPERLRILREALAERADTTMHPVEPASREAVEFVHDPAYLDELEAFCADGGGAWDPDTIATPETWPASFASAGIAQWVAQTAAPDRPGSATPFGLSRPPGHHARYDDAMGFCFFNNVAVGADTALRRTDADRVAIVDWDVHHANGTQEFVQRRANTALVSMHERGIYPGTGLETDHDRIVNVPLPSDLDDETYLGVFQATVAPSIRAFDPDLLLVSCGFDAHHRDVLASQQLTPAGYGALTGAVQEVAATVDAGVGFVLEGGYALEVLEACITAVADACAGDVPPIEPRRDERVRSVLQQVGEHALVRAGQN